jgi:pimeloyl-ACP methyl ester carboxylesterase
MPVLAAVEDLRLAGPDGYLLDARVTMAGGIESAEDVETVVLLVHGSGPASLDSDLTAVSKDKSSKNLFFKDIADALVAEGLTVLRYNKRTYQFQLDAKEDKVFLKGERVSAFKAAPLEQLIGDVNAMVDHAHVRFPAARVVVLGVSQGTYLGLQSAQAQGRIDGLVLVGFFAAGLDTLIYEQTVHRSLSIFEDIDANGDGYLDESEMKNGGQIGASMLFQRPVLDLDKDDRYGRDEFMAGNFSNLLVRDLVGIAYREHEASLPRVSEIIAGLEIPVLFFHGEWDNQTPAFHTKAIQVANHALWGKKNLEFHYYPKRGHILDPRDSYEDIAYRPADPAILSEIAQAIAALGDPQPTEKTEP